LLITNLSAVRQYTVSYPSYSLASWFDYYSYVVWPWCQRFATVGCAAGAAGLMWH